MSPYETTRASQMLTAEGLAQMIEHTDLRPDATREQIIQLCRQAAQFRFAAVCVNPSYVSMAASELANTGDKIPTVIGFPLGATFTVAKRLEAGEAIRLGAVEVDMVLNVGALKSGDHAQVLSDIRDVAATTHAVGGILKVILETVFLNDDEKRKACELSIEAQADFVKTSTGFLGGGATIADVRLIRAAVGPNIGVKAAGGIRTLEDAAAMIRAGANRIGTRSGIAIVEELTSQ
jgi:deoxyribose-phosphate aldolase